MARHLSRSSDRRRHPSPQTSSAAPAAPPIALKAGNLHRVTATRLLAAPAAWPAATDDVDEFQHLDANLLVAGSATKMERNVSTRSGVKNSRQNAFDMQITQLYQT